MRKRRRRWSRSCLLPGLPDEIRISRAQMPERSAFVALCGFSELWERAKEADRKSFGVVVNSFYELEAAYVDHCRKELGRKVWNVGPVSLCGGNSAVERGNQSSICHEECISWLNTQRPSSVVYVCFGSMCQLEMPQLAELAFALEESPHPFIWEVGSSDRTSGDQWLPYSFTERTKGKGLIIRGWAPQVLILGHPAVGGFMTHCGWNSVLESVSVSAGVAMITWPMFAEQFYNEKLVREVAEIGVGVGVEAWLFWEAELKKTERIIRRKKIVKAMERLMGDEEEAKAIRKRAREYAGMAKRAGKLVSRLMRI